ncbi:MAG: hypothetical protein ACRER0_00455 [Gammaproteobacteria bacterium]
MKYKLFILSCLALLLAACATAVPFTTAGGPQSNALVEGDSGAFGWLPGNHNLVYIEAINGKKIGASESQVLIPPGEYTFHVQCQIDMVLFGTQMYMGAQDLTFKVEAGHIYKFIADLSKNTKPGNSFFTKMYNNEKLNSCSSFVYDATGGAGPYPESVHAVPPDNSLQWTASGRGYGGHFIQDWLPKGQSESNWSQMLEIEYWSKLMFPQTADELFHSRITSATKQCPGTQLTVLSETYNEVYFELEVPSCTENPVRLQLSRFMTGQYGVYEVSYLSVKPISDTDKAAWLQALHNANTVIKH